MPGMGGRRVKERRGFRVGSEVGKSRWGERG